MRELEHTIEWAVILSQEPRLELGDWLSQPAVTTRDARVLTLAEVDREHILTVLELTGWHVSGERGAAKLLGIRKRRVPRSSEVPLRSASL